MNRVIAATILAGVAAQDPAGGWLGYAVGTLPGATRITFIEGYWKVGATPRNSNSFYSPWFGIDTSDNLNLLQPVNPWLGSEWQIYNEYYQWSPSHNFNSASHVVKAGDVLYGSITYVPANNSYTIFHSSKSDGWSVSTNIAVQMDRSGVTKNYSIAYFVYEKTAPCGDYPPDGIVTFYNISVAYDGKDATNAVAYKTAFVDDVCNNRATVVDQRTIKITWNTAAADPPAALIARSQATKGLGRRVPKAVRGGAVRTD